MDEVVIHKDALREWAAAKGKSFDEACSLGVDVGDGIRFERSVLTALMARHRTRPATLRTASASVPALPEPTVAELAANFADATARWVAGGMPVASQDQYMIRSSICETCELWDGSARLGLGKCNAPGCGCTRFKRWLATEKCPLGKWPLT